MQAEAAALEQGFSSIQAVVRVFLKKLSTKQIAISFTKDSDETVLSKKAAKRYESMYQDIKKNKNVYQAKDADDFLHQLRS